MRKLLTALIAIAAIAMLTVSTQAQSNWFYLGARSQTGGPVLPTIGTKVTIPSPIGDIGLVTIADFGKAGTGAADFVKFWHIKKLNGDFGVNFGAAVDWDQINAFDILAYFKLGIGVVYNQHLFTIKADPSKAGSIDHVVGITGAFKRLETLEDNAGLKISTWGVFATVSI